VDLQVNNNSWITALAPFESCFCKDDYCRYTRAIQKVTSGELLIKQAMRKNMRVYPKNMYISYFSK
jgi:hypothetical protein